VHLWLGRYGAKAMAFCAIPAVAVMIIGQGGEFGLPQADATGCLVAAWAGLLTINVLRSVVIYLPLRKASPPFADLREARTSRH
jgi:hypothetical protein